MPNLYSAALAAYDAGADFRRRRARCIDFHFGRQWEEFVPTDHGMVKEKQLILDRHDQPFVNNLVRRIVRNVLGVFSKTLDSRLATLEGSLRQIAEANSLRELYMRSMEEFLLSGMAIHRKWFGARDGTLGIWTELISPGDIFYNPDTRDVRGTDISFIGMFHNVNFTRWCSEFVRTPAEYEHAKALFGEDMQREIRLAEVWQRELVPREIAGRWFLDDVWRYYFVTEKGTVIREGDSPYLHGSHPFVMKCYPMLDGEIRSFVADIIDQQKIANRLIMLYDSVLRASAKGVLLVPESAADPGDMRKLAEQWSRFDGVITYKAQENIPPPQQVTGNIAGLGITEFLDIQLKMLEDVSGVNATLQGKLAANSVSGTLYSQQTENSLNSLTDIIGSFESFITACTAKDRQLLAQIKR